MHTVRLHRTVSTEADKSVRISLASAEHFFGKKLSLGPAESTFFGEKVLGEKVLAWKLDTRFASPKFCGFFFATAYYGLRGKPWERNYSRQDTYHMREATWTSRNLDKGDETDRAQESQ